MVTKIATIILVIVVMISAAGIGVGTVSASSDESDTDGDGFSDEFEENCGLENMDPNEPDIYFEVDSVRGVNLSESNEEFLKRVYSQPWNDDHSIDIHINRSQNNLSRFGGEIEESEFNEYRSEHFNNSGRGYHYLLIIEGHPGYHPYDFDGRAYGGDAVVRSGSPLPRENFEPFSHEIGHTVGLSPDDFEGIDSNYPTSYPSVMNYNYLLRVPGSLKPADEIYSNGTNGNNDFNDWAEMRASNYGSEYVDTTELDDIETDNCGPLPDTVSEYDSDNNSRISRSELGLAAADYANGDLSRADLGIVAANFASS